MTEFEKSVYSEMKSIDRILIYTSKILEVIEFQKLLTKDDIELLVRYIKFSEVEKSGK